MYLYRFFDILNIYFIKNIKYNIIIIIINKDRFKKIIYKFSINDKYYIFYFFWIIFEYIYDWVCFYW